MEVFFLLNNHWLRCTPLQLTRAAARFSRWRGRLASSPPSPSWMGTEINHDVNARLTPLHQKNASQDQRTAHLRTTTCNNIKPCWNCDKCFQSEDKWKQTWYGVKMWPWPILFFNTLCSLLNVMSTICLMNNKKQIIFTMFKYFASQMQQLYPYNKAVCFQKEEEKVFLFCKKRFCSAC